MSNDEQDIYKTWIVLERLDDWSIKGTHFETEYEATSYYGSLKKSRRIDIIHLWHDVEYGHWHIDRNYQVITQKAGD